MAVAGPKTRTPAAQPAHLQHGFRGQDSHERGLLQQALQDVGLVTHVPAVDLGGGGPEQGGGGRRSKGAGARIAWGGGAQT